MPRKNCRLEIAAATAILLFALTLGNPFENIIPTRTKNFTPMHKALLTQRGYIQFLRWELPVPEIEEFTFCVWVKSTNLTYPHSIFSYSKDEKDRLVRAWIAANGRSVNLEIDNVEIFSHFTDIQENRWYHICESWDNLVARYGLWIDGRMVLDGYAPQMAGHVIPGKGDIVLGQEYTDFDKGLEEGIEGAVLGFNLILVSAFDLPVGYFVRNKLEDSGLKPESYGFRSVAAHQEFEPIPLAAHQEFEPIPLAPLDYTESTSLDPFARPYRGIREGPVGKTRTRRKFDSVGNWKIADSVTKPLGRQLIETSFENCEKGRGSPNIGGDLMLVSWTRTPVRVFGGAIIKNVKSECGQF